MRCQSVGDEHRVSLVATGLSEERHYAKGFTISRPLMR
jgi:hypothetical protein